MALVHSILTPGLIAALALLACSSDDGSEQNGGGKGGSGAAGSGGMSAGTAGSGTGGRSAGGTSGGMAVGGGAGMGRGGRMGSGGSAGAAGAGQSGGAGRAGSGAGGSSAGGSSAGSSSAGSSGSPSTTGWLHTKGNKLYRDDDTVWMGRGANVDDAYLCGYNYELMESNIEATLENIAEGLITDWKANFIRVMLAMASYPTTSTFLTDNAEYKTPTVNAIKAMGAHPGVYVLVTLRSDLSMIGHDEDDGDPEATGLPSDATTTPDETKFPTGTDAVYEAMVDAFADSSFVMFGITNEPGGNQLPDSQIQAAMSHAVDVIRAREDELGVPHHIVSVQGQDWTSDIGFYAENPLPQDNVVYEVHGYPPSKSDYTYSEIPVIIGEYGTLSNEESFYADLETKQISNLAFSFSPYSDCEPDMLQVNHSSTQLNPTPWGETVKAYLTSHAP